MTDAQREELAGHLRRTRTMAVVDEAHQALALEGQEMPRPFAAYAPDTISIGSASKSFWGGLRLGWIRAPHAAMERLTRARVSLDLGAPVLEQLVLVHLLSAADEVLSANRSRLRDQRDALVAAVSASLPEWTFRVPGGGLALWCQLPGPYATATAAEAEARGAIVAPGPVFAPEGGLDTFLRIPYVRPADDMAEAVRRIADAWAVVRDRPGRPSPSGRVMVA
jgi:DNA-binding transcriptional MocR family regulator